jgi:hypothetical protein
MHTYVAVQKLMKKTHASRLMPINNQNTSAFRLMPSAYFQHV